MIYDCRIFQGWHATLRVLYEDLRVYTIWRAEISHFKTQHMSYRKTGTEVRKLQTYGNFWLMAQSGKFLVNLPHVYITKKRPKTRTSSVWTLNSAQRHLWSFLKRMRMRETFKRPWQPLWGWQPIIIGKAKMLTQGKFGPNQVCVDGIWTHHTRPWSHIICTRSDSYMVMPKYSTQCSVW